LAGMVARADLAGDFGVVCGCGLGNCSADCGTIFLRDHSARGDLPTAELCGDKLGGRAVLTV
jgi:hypothetical protein